MRRLDTPARKSEDLPASIVDNALRGTGVPESILFLSATPGLTRPRVRFGIGSLSVERRGRRARASRPGLAIRSRRDESHEARLPGPSMDGPSVRLVLRTCWSGRAV
jgi:hypothetical protein